MEDKLKSILKTMKMNESVFSMVLGVITIVVIGMLVFNFWKQNKPVEVAKEEITEEVKLEKVGDVEVIENENGEKIPTQLPEKYTVQKGDHLWAIAEKFYGSGYNWVDIAKENGLKNPGVLLIGQELKLPKVAVKIVKKEMADSTSTLKPEQKIIEGAEYTVQKGDTLWDIAVRAYQDGYRWPELAKVNKVTNPNIIEVGQVLKIPRQIYT